MSKHTPGPWMLPHLADDTHSCNCRTVCAEGYCGSICEISVDNGIKSISAGGNDCPPLEEAKANARLISGAPDLLAALERAADELEASGLAHDHPSVADARSAVAKSKGA